MEVYQKNREAIIKEIQEAKARYKTSFPKEALSDELKFLRRQLSQKEKASTKARNAVEVAQTIMAQKLKALEVAEREYAELLGQISGLQEELHR